MTLKIEFPHRKLLLCQVWWPLILRKCRYKFFEFVTWPRDQKVTWLALWGLLTVSYHSAKFNGYRYCESADISFLNLWRDHVIKRSRDFEDWVPQPQVTTLPSLVAIGIAAGQICLFMCFSFKSIQNKDQISMFKFIFRWPYIMTIWLNKK